MNNPIEDIKSELHENPWSYDLSDIWDMIEEGDWTDSGKYETKEDIIKHLPSGKLFEASFYRTGDHWQGYDTELSSVTEVEPYEALVVLYRPVKLLDATVPAMSKAKEVSNE